MQYYFMRIKNIVTSSWFSGKKCDNKRFKKLTGLEYKCQSWVKVMYEHISSFWGLMYNISNFDIPGEPL